MEQDHQAATFAPKVNRDTGRIDWDRSGREIAAHVRGMDAVPGAWSTLDGAPVKLFRPAVVGFADDPASAAPSTNGGPPTPRGPAETGTVLRTDPSEGVLVRVLE